MSKSNVKPNTSQTPISDEAKKAEEQRCLAQINKIGDALSKVPPEYAEAAVSLANSLEKVELGVSFNQTAMDLFDLAVKISTKRKIEEKLKMSGHRSIFEAAAAKIGKTIPISKFSFAILEFAPEIYNENDDFFLNMKVPDTIDVDKEVGATDAGTTKSNSNDLNIINTQEFKELWKKLNNKEKRAIRENVIKLTLYSHAYFISYIREQTKSK